MNTKSRILTLLFIVTAVTSAMSAYLAYAAAEAVIEASQKRELELVAKALQNGIAAQASKAAARASIVASLPSIKEAFRRQDRKELVRRLSSALLIQRDQFGVRECQFHLPPALSFIRMYDINAGHGEDLSGFRQMVLAVNKDKEPRRGIEIGRRGLSVRGIYPIEDDQGHIGSIEFGMSFEPILQEAKESTGFESAVFVKDELMTRVATLIPRPGSEKIIGNMQLNAVTDWALLKPLVSPELLAQGYDIVSQTPVLDGVRYGVVMVPLLDYKGENIGVILAARSFAPYATQARWALTRSIAMAGLQFLLLAGALLVVVNAMLLRPLQEIAGIGAASDDEAKKAALDGYAAREDEIGAIARLLEHGRPEARGDAPAGGRSGG